MRNLSGAQRRALYFLRGTGRYAGKDARWKNRFCDLRKYKLRTLLSLMHMKLADHAWCGRWYLTEDGRDAIRRGI